MESERVRKEMNIWNREEMDGEFVCWCEREREREIESEMHRCVRYILH